MKSLFDADGRYTDEGATIENEFHRALRDAFSFYGKRYPIREIEYLAQKAATDLALEHLISNPPAPKAEAKPEQIKKTMKPHEPYAQHSADDDDCDDPTCSHY